MNALMENIEEQIFLKAIESKKNLEVRHKRPNNGKYDNFWLLDKKSIMF